MAVPPFRWGGGRDDEDLREGGRLPPLPRSAAVRPVACGEEEEEEDGAAACRWPGAELAAGPAFAGTAGPVAPGRGRRGAASGGRLAAAPGADAAACVGSVRCSAPCRAAGLCRVELQLDFARRPCRAAGSPAWRVAGSGLAVRTASAAGVCVCV